MCDEAQWLYYADALPEYASKLVRIEVGDRKAERYTAHNGWVDADGVQSEVKWTGDWDFIWADDVDTVIANIDNPKPVKPWSYWNPSLQLSLWFVAYLDAIEAGVITADQIPPESGLNTEVVAALKAVESGIFPTNCTGATPLSVSGANTRSSKLTLRWRLNAARLKPTGRRMRAGELSHFGSLTPGHSCSTSVRPHRQPPASLSLVIVEEIGG